MTHYRTLNVDPDATPEQIRAAYRAAASDAHPDREGGDATRMAKVNAANDILSDPDKRAAYDKSIDPTAQAQERQAAIDKGAADMLMQVFAVALQRNAQYPAKFAREQTAAALEDFTHQRLAKLDKARRLKKMRSKVRTPAGTPNLFRDLIDTQVAGLRREVEQLNRALKVASRAKKMAQDYQEDIPAPKVAMPALGLRGFGPMIHTGAAT